MTTTKITLTPEQTTDLREIGEDLRTCERDLNAGREPCVSHTPNGREIRLTPGGFAVQPANDNYWLTVPTVDAAMDAFENPGKYRD